MTLKEISQMIASIGLPYAYDHFTKKNTPGHPPYICFTYPTSDNFTADDKVYQKIKELNIELYTDNKEPTLEEAVEDALDAYGLVYDSSETYLDTENMFMVTWTTEVLITKEET